MTITITAYGEQKPLELEPAAQDIMEMDLMEVESRHQDQLSAMTPLRITELGRIFEVHTAFLRMGDLVALTEDPIRYYVATLETALIWELG